ncbi:MAG: RNA polymerase sigma factor [Acidimicrobiia bacterium]
MTGGRDAEFVEKVRAGDTAAFAELYRAHAPGVAVAVRANIHGPETVADVVQETFLRALEQLDTLREPDHFRSWVLAIARNAAVDERRQHRRVITDLDIAGDLASAEVGPEELAALRDAVRTVRGCVAGLSRRDATAVALVSELGFSPSEVGAALGISPGAAKVAVHRARRRLQAALELEARVRERASVVE